MKVILTLSFVLLVTGFAFSQPRDTSLTRDQKEYLLKLSKEYSAGLHVFEKNEYWHTPGVIVSKSNYDKVTRFVSTSRHIVYVKNEHSCAEEYKKVTDSAGITTFYHNLKPCSGDDFEKQEQLVKERFDKAVANGELCFKKKDYKNAVKFYEEAGELKGLSIGNYDHYIIAENGGVLDTIVLRGQYSGRNLYIQNPFAGNGVGFCTVAIRVNGQVPSDGGSAFEVDMTSLQLKVGDPVTVLVVHKPGCKPKILNPDVLLPPVSFEIVSMHFDSLGVLRWTSKNETGFRSYLVEQFKWNKWTKIGMVEERSKGQNDYAFKFHPNSGKNILRVKQTGYGQSGNLEITRCSDSIQFVSSVPRVTIPDSVIQKNVVFSDSTWYEVYDKFGNMVKKGFGKSLDCSNLPDDLYYLNFDNSTQTIYVQRKKTGSVVH